MFMMDRARRSAVDPGGRRDVMGLWAGKGRESASSGSLLADPNNRAVGDVFFVVCDALKGLQTVLKRSSLERSCRSA